MQVVPSADSVLIMLLLTSLLCLHRALPSEDVEERRDELECDRRRGPCLYPTACSCNPRLRYGQRFRTMYHYNGRLNQCLPGGNSGNCNGFTTMFVCLVRCSRAER
ncbi:R.appendiculatus Kunitz/BPTI-like protein [Rhipicephalus microplus]|uniref:R.appendiculatus Kunitz/BPTI-like protein n=1 Tax=Rhipicephalus microplus TaxID=6941 RepID=UPI003F6B1653